VLDLLLRNEVSSFSGAHYQLDGATFRPVPIQQPRPPLTLAAHGPKMLSLIAPYVDRWNSMGSPEEMAERGKRLDAALVVAGRDPGAVVKSVLYVPSVTPDEDPWRSLDAFTDFVGRYCEQGVRDFIFQPAHATPDLIERVAHEVLPGLR